MVTRSLALRIGAALALVALIFGVSFFVRRDKTRLAVAGDHVKRLSRGILHCSAVLQATARKTPGHPPVCLPGSSPPVPGNDGKIRGREFTAETSAWLHPTFRCARYSVAGAQRVQVQWVRQGNDRGEVLARGDLDGDGTIETTLALPIRCVDEGGKPWQPGPDVGPCRCQQNKLEQR